MIGSKQKNKMDTKIIEIKNGFVITQRLIGSPNSYFQAKKDSVVFTSKSLPYIRKKVSEYV